MTNNQSKMNTFEVAEVDEFMPIDIANGFISVIEKKNMPDELKLWAIDNIKNFNTLCYAKRKMLYDNILTKLVEDN